MLIKSAVAQQGFLISEAFNNAWNVFKKDWIVVYAVQLLPIAIAIVYTMLMDNYDQQSGMAGLWSIVYMIVQFIVSMGVIKAYLDITRGKKVSMETFTSVAPLTLKFITAQILMMLIVLGGFLLLIVPGIYFSLKYMFTPYLVVDKGMGPIEALKASGEMTKGVKWDMVGFIAATVVLMYSGILALFVGLLVTIPLGTLAYVILYDRLRMRLK